MGAEPELGRGPSFLPRGPCRGTGKAWSPGWALLSLPPGPGLGWASLSRVLSVKGIQRARCAGFCSTWLFSPLLHERMVELVIGKRSQS